MPFLMGSLFLAAACGDCAEIARTFPQKDLTHDLSGDVVVAAGTKTVYQGHPTTVKTADGRVIAVWCTPHGGHCGPAAETTDGGRTWTRIDERFPAGFARHVNCPSAYRLVGPDGKARLWVWSQSKKRATDAADDDHSCRRDLSRAMPSVMSEDEGRTWKEMPPLGEKFACVMAFASVVQLKDGAYLGMFHVGPGGRDASPLRLRQSVTRDGGFTWSDPVELPGVEGKDLCEPFVFRSPAGDELGCLIRENTHKGRSLMMFSRDEGRTWSRPVDTPWALSGDRHQGVLLPDGRYVIVFRDQAPASRRENFTAWVGTWDEIKTGRAGGSYRVNLLFNYAFSADCGYPGIERLADGALLATTYVSYRDDDALRSVVSKRFRVEDLDRLPVVNAPHVVGKIAESARYESINPRFKKAFEFLRRADLAALKPGRYEIDGDNCWAMIQESDLTPLEGAKIEAHRRYVDVQAPITGPETYGLYAMTQKDLKRPFDREKDFVLFGGETVRPVTLQPGEFAIFLAPYGAHAPGHSSDGARKIRKLVIKVRADY